jgi:hypothetical protein
VTQLTPKQRAQLEAIVNGGPPEPKPTGWLAGAPMDPTAQAPEPLPTLPGFPFLHAGAGAVIVGPTGGGRSSLVQACAYDAARGGLRVAYLGSEVTEREFNARAADLADRRGDRVDDALREQLARVRYLNLATVIAHAWRHPGQWVEEVVESFDVVEIDPLSTVAVVLDLDFDRSNAEFVRFYDRLVQPLAAADKAVVLLDNLGHAPEARSRAKGVSAKQDRADLTFACKLKTQPLGMVITAKKVRTVRAPFAHGDTWVFDRDTQQVRRDETGSGDEPTWRPTVLMGPELVVRHLALDHVLVRHVGHGLGEPPRRLGDERPGSNRPSLTCQSQKSRLMAAVGAGHVDRPVLRLAGPFAELAASAPAHQSISA